MHNVFGSHKPHHSFSIPEFDWGIRLHEPQITKGLAALLNLGDTQIRTQRLLAFLKAFGVQNIQAGDLVDATVHAEKVGHNNCRIDILVDNIYCQPDGDAKAVIIEAKFGHKITKGQLSNYWNTVKYKKEGFILGLTEQAANGLTGRQSKLWKFISWRDMWLKFEKHRPDEHNPSLTFFMNTLWHRIDGLNQKDK